MKFLMHLFLISCNAMPREEDFSFAVWTDGSPLKSTDDRYWRYSLNPTGSIVPEGVEIKISRNPSCNTWFGWSCGRWYIKIAATKAVSAGVAGPVTFKANGKSLGVNGIGHWSYNGNALYVFPVKKEADYSASMLEDFKTKFPVGTVVTVTSSCSGGFNANGPCGGVAPQSDNVLAIHSGSFGMRFDVKKFELPHFGIYKSSLDQFTSPDIPAATLEQTQSQLSTSSMKLRVQSQDGTSYTCTGFDWQGKSIPYGFEFPLRVVKSGRFHTLVDLVDLQFVNDATGAAVSTDVLTATFEVVVWPDCVTLRTTAHATGAR
jgi:hypothetical protein